MDAEGHSCHRSPSARGAVDHHPLALTGQPAPHPPNSAPAKSLCLQSGRALTRQPPARRFLGPLRAPRGLQGFREPYPAHTPAPLPPPSPLGDVERAVAQGAPRQHRLRVGLLVANALGRRREPPEETHRAAAAASLLHHLLRRRRKRKHNRRPPEAELLPRPCVSGLGPFPVAGGGPR